MRNTSNVCACSDQEGQARSFPIHFKKLVPEGPTSAFSRAQTRPPGNGRKCCECIYIDTVQIPILGKSLQLNTKLSGNLRAPRSARTD